MQLNVAIPLVQPQVVWILIFTVLASLSGCVRPWPRVVFGVVLCYHSLLSFLVRRQFESWDAAGLASWFNVTTLSRHLVPLDVGAWPWVVDFDGDVCYKQPEINENSKIKIALLTFSGDSTEHREALVLISWNREGVLVIMTGAWQRAVMRDALLVIYTIIGLSWGSKSEHMFLVLTRVGLFEVTGEFVCTWLWELVEILLNNVRRTWSNAKWYPLVSQCRLKVISNLVVPIICKIEQLNYCSGLIDKMKWAVNSYILVFLGFLNLWPIPNENICLDLEVFIGWPLGCMLESDRVISAVVLLEFVMALGVRERFIMSYFMLGASCFNGSCSSTDWFIAII